MLRALLLIVSTLLVSSCGGPRYVDFFPYHDDGTIKPHIVLLPVLDSSRSTLPWNLAEEINQGIRFELMNEGELFLYSMEEMKTGLGHLGKPNFFVDKTLLTESYGSADFVILVEVLEHSYQTYTTADLPQSGYMRCPTKMTLKVRVRVIDVRASCSRVVLQEVISDFDFVPRVCADLQAEDPAECQFWMKSVQKAHRRIIYNISRRLESVIKSAF